MSTGINSMYAMNYILEIKVISSDQIYAQNNRLENFSLSSRNSFYFPAIDHYIQPPLMPQYISVVSAGSRESFY